MGGSDDSSIISRRAVLSALGVGGGLTTGFALTRQSREANDLPDSNDAAAQLDSRLDRIGQDTWAFFDEFSHDDTGFAPDRVDATAAGYTRRSVTSPANVGLQLLATVAASELEVISKSSARERAHEIIVMLRELDRWNGLFYRWYDIGNGAVAEDHGGWWEISTIDNGWLVAGLVAAGGAFPELRPMADEILAGQSFDRFYDPDVSNPFEGGEPFGQLYGGFDARSGDDLGFHYGVFNAETRIASYVGIGNGDVPRSHWWDTFRTFPPEWDQQGDPEGEFRAYDDNRVWEGHYEHEGIRYVPSWGGSMFESLMPSLVLPERSRGQHALGANNRRQVQLQINHAEEQGYDAWGFSPCGLPDGYAEFGVARAGIEGYERDDVATPHATLLGLEYASESEIAGALDAYVDRGLDTEYGFYDSMSLVSDWTTNAYLALDQGISLVAIANYLRDGAVRDAFVNHPVGSGPTGLLEAERFTI
ncbi:hypothetical protein SAMN06269185_2866 [Natronoarchaeum philippinense]|uniref:Uncharacterized protein n=1 Tax=Natronoarchaeum philippinense TaxID=558529 RepID=A0A285P6H3_NATPI|nr:glucoamylase family protein [Natronoarchaeum philippinense]SNZ17048.1 hypothetical protein SAMN06269185_2866 [Natronoarchaeum philippinense]